MLDFVVPLDYHGVAHVVSTDAGAPNLDHSSTGPLTTGTSSLHAAAGQAPTSQLVWTQHPLAGFDSQYDSSSCWFEQDSNGLGEWHNCGRWEMVSAPDGRTGGHWVQDAVPDWEEVPPDADGPVLAQQKAALVSFVRQPGEDSSRGSSSSFSKTKLASSGGDVSQDHVVSKASPSHLVLTAHAFTLAALQVLRLPFLGGCVQVEWSPIRQIVSDTTLNCCNATAHSVKRLATNCSSLTCSHPGLRRRARATRRACVPMRLTMLLLSRR